MTAVDVALERHLRPGEQLLGEEPVGVGRVGPGECGDVRVARRVAVDLVEGEQLARVVDAEGVLGEPPDDRLHEKGHVERCLVRRAWIEQGETRRRLGRDAHLEGARGRLVLTRDEGARARAREPAALAQKRGEERGGVLRAHDPVGGNHRALVEEGSRVEGVQLVEVGALEPDAVALFEPGGVDRLQIPLLRA